MITKYKGCLIFHRDNLFFWGGKPYVSLYIAQKAIDLALRHLQRSIAK